jgi:acetoin:2,6-dichlorophenolindophenol oxidoreductase subunit alpha
MSTPQLLLAFYEKMVLIRRFEMRLFELAKTGILRGSVHFCTGEEAAAVGTCLAIGAGDYILPTHRGHGHELAKGSDPRRLLAEIAGKATGLCGGRGGTMHVFDRSTNNLGSQGILGAQFPISVGVGLAIKLQKLENAVVLCFFGDGTSNIGNFYEALNIAALWRLPILFVCNNNAWGMGTRYVDTCTTDVDRKAQLFGLATASVDGNDVEQVYAATGELVSGIRKDMMPALIELKTYRIHGHSAFDNRPYRSAEEIDEWKKRDPIDRLAKRLAAEGAGAGELRSIEEKVDAVVAEAEKFAIDSPLPAGDGLSAGGVE